MFRDAVFEFLRSVGIDRRKISQYLGLFFVTLIFALICISMYLKAVCGPSDDARIGALMGRVFELSLIAAIPFAVFAYVDKNWRSSDAAPVLAAAWAAAYAIFSTKCPMCMLGVGIPFVIFTFSALLAHTAGGLCRFMRQRQHA